MDPQTANGWIEAHFPQWVQALSPHVEKMACTGAVVTLPVSDAICEADGLVSPAALAGLAETAMVIACAGHFRGYRPVSRTNLDLQFLQPARGDQLDCTATVVRASKTLIFTRAVLAVEPSGKEVATATATYLVP